MSQEQKKLNKNLNETEEENFWNSCFDYLQKIKDNQKKNNKIENENFEKTHLKDGKIIDKLQVFTDMVNNNVQFYFNSLNYNKLTNQDTTHALTNYKVGQKNLRLLQTYKDLTNILKKETPTWEGYCKWKKEYINKYWEKKIEKKPKKNN